MDNAITEFFRRFRHLRLSDFRDLYNISHLKSYKAGEIIAREDEYFGYAIGIRSGIIRTYVLTPKGEERTVRFASKRDFAGCAACLLHDQPSTEFLQAVEDTKVILVDTHKLKKQARTNIRLLKTWSDGISEAFYESVHRIRFFVTLTPEERYRQLLDESPELIHRVPQKYLASYIGVTTVSLSRIRNRVLKNP